MAEKEKGKRKRNVRVSVAMVEIIRLLVCG